MQESHRTYHITSQNQETSSSREGVKVPSTGVKMSHEFRKAHLQHVSDSEMIRVDLVIVNQGWHTEGFLLSRFRWQPRTLKQRSYFIIHITYRKYDFVETPSPIVAVALGRMACVSDSGIIRVGLVIASQGCHTEGYPLSRFRWHPRALKQWICFTIHTFSIASFVIRLRVLQSNRSVALNKHI